MSTKLYNGLRLTEHAPDLFTLTREISVRMREVFQDLAAGVIAQCIAKVVDDPDHRQKSLETDPAPYDVKRAAEKIWLDYQNSLNPHLRGHDPLRFEIVFGEARDANGTRRLAYTFSDRNAYVKALLAMRTDTGEPYFVDYHYQDQSDRPDEVTKIEWNQRLRDWDQITSSTDSETDGTFGHAPGWRLPDTIRNVFGSWLFWKEAAELRLDEHVTQQERFTESLQRAVWDRLPDKTTELSEVYQRLAAVRHAIDKVIDRPEFQNLELPAPLTELLNTKLIELPTLFGPDPDLIDAVLREYREQAEGDSA